MWSKIKQKHFQIKWQFMYTKYCFNIEQNDVRPSSVKVYVARSSPARTSGYTEMNHNCQKFISNSKFSKLDKKRCCSNSKCSGLTFHKSISWSIYTNFSLLISYYRHIFYQFPYQKSYLSFTLSAIAEVIIPLLPVTLRASWHELLLANYSDLLLLRLTTLHTSCHHMPLAHLIDVFTNARATTITDVVSTTIVWLTLLNNNGSWLLSHNDRSSGIIRHTKIKLCMQ